MKQSRNKITVEGAAPLPRVLETLEALVAALKTGSAEVRLGDQSIVLGPRDILGFELSARARGKRQRLALELTFRKLGAADADPGLSIRPGPAPTVARAIADYAAAAAAGASTDAEGTETSEAARPESAGEAHEGEAPRADKTAAT
jgi:amphi-Trp domain-containing protein